MLLAPANGKHTERERERERERCARAIKSVVDCVTSTLMMDVLYSSFFSAASFFSLVVKFLSCVLFCFFAKFFFFFVCRLSSFAFCFVLFFQASNSSEQQRFLADELDFGKTTGIKEHKDDSRTLF